MNTAAGKNPVVNVAVAIVRRDDGRVLLAERPRNKVSGGYWEFPGGKFEVAETPVQALARELHEEVGVELDAAHPWLTYDHRYPDKIVRLHFYRVTAWHGTPRGREGQRVSWEDPRALTVAPLLPANDKILTALNLPPVYAITNTAKYGVAGFMTRLLTALESGVRLIQVREHAMTADQLAQVTRRVTALAHRYGAKVLVNDNLAVAQRAGADGIHLSSERLMRLAAPPAIGFWAASCHSAEELARAATLGADFAVLSPVLPTATHPGAITLGWEKFNTLSANCPVPVYALGGMRLELLDTAMSRGAHGIALLSGIW